MSSLLKATAAAIIVAVALLAATAEAAAGSFIPAIATRDFLTSPVFFWVTAQAIVIWLLLSRRGRTTDGDDDSNAPPSPGHDGEAAHDAVDGVYMSSSEYEAFSDAGGRREDAPVSKRLVGAREARAARRSDRPRVRKKPAAGQDAPSPMRAVAAEAAREPDDEVRARSELVGTPVASAAAASEVSPGDDGVDDEEEDVSMDTLWQSIVQRRAARPVVVQKSESWGNDELPRLQRVAETAAATPRREMRKSVSAVTKQAAAPEPRQPPPSVPSAVKRMGWRTRDVLVSISPDELLRRAESFIRRQREHLRLQRQESEQRQLLLRRFYLPAPAGPGRPIRV